MSCSQNQQQMDGWTLEQDEILIDFGRAQECLYNIQLKNDRKTQLKQTLWKEIGGILKKQVSSSISILDKLIFIEFNAVGNTSLVEFICPQNLRL